MRRSNAVCARPATMSEQYMFHMWELIVEVIATVVILIVILIVMIIKIM